LSSHQLSPMRLSSSIAHASIRSLIEQNCLRSLAHPVLYNQQNVTDHGPHRPFGENQLSLGSISILPLTTSHPMLLQQQRVRASCRLSSTFTLLMASSPSFGSSSYSKRAIHTWFPFASPQIGVRHKK
ncbi:MAG: hypothetical protein ACD_13C00087G0001, partial [uncultured bacterium]